MAKTTIFVRGTFHGLYEMGKGWLVPHFDWTLFWRNYKGIWWKYFATNTSLGEGDYLVAIRGSLYLHPQYFDCVLWGNSHETFISELNELKSACEECAKALGGTFTMETSEIMTNNITLKKF